MLPFEAHLLAAGWPRYKEAEQGGAESDGGSSGSEGERVVEREGSRGARMLFQARRWACSIERVPARCAAAATGGAAAGPSTAEAAPVPAARVRRPGWAAVPGSLCCGTCWRRLPSSLPHSESQVAGHSCCNSCLGTAVCAGFALAGGLFPQPSRPGAPCHLPAACVPAPSAGRSAC